MRAVILHGGVKSDALGDAAYEMVCDALRSHQWVVETERLHDMQIHPCVGCFKCWFQTPGECVQKDDGRRVAEAIACCDAMVFLSPVTFGGYCSRLKLAVDRMIPTISPLFEWVDGEMHHRLRYTPARRLLAIGWQRESDPEGAKVFSDLARRNALNMHAPAWGSAVIYGGQTPADQSAELLNLVAKLEVVQ